MMSIWVVGLMSLLAAVPRPAERVSPPQPVLLGSEVLEAGGFKELQGKRVGLLTNPSGINRRGESTIDLLRRAPGVKLVALFAPEHGINADVPGGVEFPDAIDRRTGLPVYSLYGKGPTRRPTPKMLVGIEALVYDVQDIGCRSYTFISTMGSAMEACAQAGVEFVVLDRPNPLGGLRVEGPMIDPKYYSHVGQWQIPYVYGMTCGELARMINGEKWTKARCKLTVISMKGWRRSMTWSETGLPWRPTSPNITTPGAALGYSALGLLGWIADGSGLDIGYKFKMPYESVTANWINSQKLCQRLGDCKLRGVNFVPVQGTNNGKPYQGVRLELTSPATAPMVALSFYLLESIKLVTGRDLFLEAVKRERNFNMFDKLTGSAITRRDLSAGRSAANIVKSWKEGEDAFRAKRQKYLIY